MGDPYINDLIAVEDALFVVELISKTRDNGLPWVALAPDLYTITLCDPSECLVPAKPAESWHIFVGRNQANYQPLPYVYHLEVLVDGLPFMSIDSRQTNFVEQLFRAIEIYSVPPCEWRIDQAIDFVSGIPTSPFSDNVHFVMCGGVLVGGSARSFVEYRPYIQPFGVLSSGSSPFKFIFKPPATKQGVVSESNVAPMVLIFRPPVPTTGNVAGGSAASLVEFYAKANLSASCGLTATGGKDCYGIAAIESSTDIGATGIRPKDATSLLTSASILESQGEAIKTGKADLLANTSASAHSNVNHSSSALLISSTIIDAIGRKPGLQDGSASININTWIGGNSANMSLSVSSLSNTPAVTARPTANYRAKSSLPSRTGVFAVGYVPGLQDAYGSLLAQSTSHNRGGIILGGINSAMHSLTTTHGQGTVSAMSLPLYPPVPSAVKRVVEDWVLVAFGEPIEVVPQASTVMYADATDTYANTYLYTSFNYWDYGPFGDGGGIQMVFYNGNEAHAEVAQGALLGASVDTITWSQELALVNDNLVATLDGTSSTFGNFTNPPMQISMPTLLTSFEFYDPNASTSNSMVTYGGPPSAYVTTFGITAVRWYDENGIVAEDPTPRMIIVNNEYV